MRVGRLKRFLWAVALFALGVFALRAFYGDVYRIASDSMLPTLCEGEYVFVRFDRSAPRRGDLVVWDRGDQAVVKRAVALGGEEVLISKAGDLFVDGELLRRGPGASLIPIFDDRVQVLDEHFVSGSGELKPWGWNEALEAYELDARSVERGHAAGLLRLHQRVNDGYVDESGERVYGDHHVGDTAVEFSVRVLDAGGRMRISLVEQADTFEVSFELDAQGPEPLPGRRLRVALRRRAGAELELVDERELACDLAEWTRVRFENVDNTLHLILGDEPIWSIPYERNTRHPKDTAGVGLSIGERIAVGGEGCHLALRDLRVWRDRHYTQRGTFGIGKPLALAPDELYLLGDNSDASRDSRDWGPVSRASLLGRAAWVVWPIRAMRPLERPLR